MTYHARQRNNSSTPVYAGKNFAGSVAGGILRKTVDSKKHLIRVPWPAWGFDKSVLRDAAELGATLALVYDQVTGNSYGAPFEVIYKHGFSVDRGYGDQLALALDHWSVNGATPVAQQRVAATNQERKDLQLSLFGEVG